MNKAPKLDGQWFYEQYVVREKSITTIAHEIGWSEGAVAYRLRKYGIPRRSRGQSKRLTVARRGPSKEELITLYIDRQESIERIAQKTGNSYSVIRRRLHYYGIPIRDRGTPANKLHLCAEAQEFVIGELLGDGYLQPLRKSANYQHGTKHRTYLVWLASQLASWGIRQSGSIRRQDTPWGIIYKYESHYYRELLPLHDLFYPNGKKVVPHSIRLTPLTVRQWYIGDGCLVRDKRRTNARPYIILATCAFDEKSIQILLAELARLGIKATHQKANNVVAISTYSTKDFLDYIGPCPIECYAYKWDYEGKLKVRE